MKLWGESKLSEVVEEFLVGSDPELDVALLPCDCAASITHARVLHRAGILTADETEKLTEELRNIIDRWHNSDIQISACQEDCHTFIEETLTQRLGDLGRKLHAGRSRNDQILTALRIYYLVSVDGLGKFLDSLVQSIRTFSQLNAKVPMPGFTHTRKAMPSSVGMWADALADGLREDKDLLEFSRSQMDQCPLGTGAGYGVPLDLDREFAALEMGFSRVQLNPIHAQMSRPKLEGTLIHALATVLYDLNRAASDIILFSMPEFGFFALPDELCTGSSIMPHKKNPDVLEVVRGKFHAVLGFELQVRTMAANLIHGYHRDVQLTKEPTMRALDETRDSLDIMRMVFDSLKVDRKRCREAMTEELYATDRVYALVKEGVPFREAYDRVKRELKKGLGE